MVGNEKEEGIAMLREAKSKMTRYPTGEKGEKRPKMPIGKRAKQFMPFSALVGLEEALHKKEWEVETKQKLNYTTLCQNSQSMLK